MCVCVCVCVCVCDIMFGAQCACMCLRMCVHRTGKCFSIDACTKTEVSNL